MRNKFLIGVAAAALTVGATLASAQSPQPSPSGGGAEQRGAPSGAGGGAQMNQERGQGPSGTMQQRPAGQDHNRARDSRSPRETTGQGGGGMSNERGSGQPNAQPSQRGGDTQRGEHQRQEMQQRQGQGTQAPREGTQRQNAQSPSRNGGTAQQGRDGQGGAASATLSTEQRTQIRQTIISERNAPRVANVNFSVNVGTVVPRSVKLVTVPQSVITIHPAWRGYRYFIVGDEIVIVEPGTLRIVAVLPA